MAAAAAVAVVVVAVVQGHTHNHTLAAFQRHHILFLCSCPDKINQHNPSSAGSALLPPWIRDHPPSRRSNGCPPRHQQQADQHPRTPFRTSQAKAVPPEDQPEEWSVGESALECDDVIRSAHVSRSGEQQATASRGHRWIEGGAKQSTSVLEQILGC